MELTGWILPLSLADCLVVLGVSSTVGVRLTRLCRGVSGIFVDATLSVAAGAGAGGPAGAEGTVEPAAAAAAARAREVRVSRRGLAVLVAVSATGALFA